MVNREHKQYCTLQYFKFLFSERDLLIEKREVCPFVYNIFT